MYFHCGGNLAPVARLAPAGSTEVQLSVALMNLLAGPTDDERRMGFNSTFSSSTAGSLQSVSVSVDGQAVCSFQDFSGAAQEATSPEGMRRMLNEIRATVFQFSELQLVFLQFDNDCERFWSWLGAGCTPIYR